MTLKIDIPICPYCQRQCNPAGGALNGSIVYWRCFECKYDVEDIIAEAEEQKQLPEQQ